MVKVLTWNMQGGNDEKWGTAKTFLKDYDVICLQEGGTPPSYMVNAMTKSTLTNYSYLKDLSEKIGRNKVGYNLAHYTWESTKDGKEASNTRCSLAVLSKLNFDYIRVLAPTTHKKTRRPVIGVRLETDEIWAYCIHAPSGRSFSAAGYTREMVAQMVGDDEWFCAGDYNCEPLIMERHLEDYAGLSVESTGKATQQGGGQLDYVVVSGANATDKVLCGLNSDHVAVGMALTF
jgi:hypothetical protein